MISHPRAASSWKPVRFGEASAQPILRERQTRQIAGTACTIIEPDIAYPRDLGAHLFLEVVVNGITHSITDPKRAQDTIPLILFLVRGARRAAWVKRLRGCVARIVLMSPCVSAHVGGGRLARQGRPLSAFFRSDDRSDFFGARAGAMTLLLLGDYVLAGCELETARGICAMPFTEWTALLRHFRSLATLGTIHGPPHFQNAQ